MPPRGSKSSSPSRNHLAQPRGRRFTRRMPRNLRCCLGLMCESPDRWDRAVNLDRHALSQTWTPKVSNHYLHLQHACQGFFLVDQNGVPFFELRAKSCRNTRVSRVKISGTDSKPGIAPDSFLADTGGKKRTVYVQELSHGNSCFIAGIASESAIPARSRPS